MKLGKWKDFAELVGIASIVATLLFVALQLELSRRTGNSARMLAEAANRIELTNSINDNADVWVKGLAGDELTSAEAQIFENLLLTMNEYYFLSARAKRDVGNEAGAERG